MDGAPGNDPPAPEADRPEEAEGAAGPPRVAPPLAGPAISRRSFIGGAAGAGALIALRPTRLLRLTRPQDDIGPINPINPIQPINPVTPQPFSVAAPGWDFMISAERDADLVLLDFYFYGFEVAAGTPPVITPTTVTTDPYFGNPMVVVQFAPQAMGEGEYPWQALPPSEDFVLVVDPPPIVADASGPSWLVFSVDESIPLNTMSVADLLDWSNWELVVPPVAVEGLLVNDATPGPLQQMQTAIEFPYAVYLAPVVHVGELDGFSFSTEFAPIRTEPLVGPSGCTDLWSTSLTGTSRQIFIEGGSPPAGPVTPWVPPVSAVWMRDFPFATLAVPSATPETEIVYEVTT